MKTHPDPIEEAIVSGVEAEMERRRPPLTANALQTALGIKHPILWRWFARERALGPQHRARVLEYLGLEAVVRVRRRSRG